MWKKFRIAGNSGSSIPPTVEEATEGTHGYPGEYRVAALRERRLLMALRGVCIALIMSILLIAVLAFIILSMMPLKEIRPFLVQVAEEGTVVAAIRPIQDTFDAKDLLTEKLVREYVVNRHEILRS
ncbi:MAG: VirB8/TrbF family protein, partial [Roseovarius sp.]|nr:VirB8/TrbF family protein [Roseovarius sp.]